MKRRKHPSFSGSEWTIPNIEKGWDIISKLAKEKYGWEGYPVQFEILSSGQFIDMQINHFMPTYYSHWSFGKHSIQAKEEYISGRNRGLAYEVIINTDPCVCYIHEDNSMMMQLLVTCHAAIGHNHFFKNNYMYKEWTDPAYITDFLLYAKHYISKCESVYGIPDVSATLDMAHLFSTFSLFKHHKNNKSKAREKEKRDSRYDDIFANYDPLIDGDFETYKYRKLDSYDEECDYEDTNLLYFLEHTTTHQSKLKPWQKEIFSIVRNIEQYFYPQMQEQVINEGFASFVHYTLMNDLYDFGYIDEGYMLEFVHNHTGVCAQHPFSAEHGQRINPYYLGFNLFQEVKRLASAPTEEDLEHVPQHCNKDWVKAVNAVVENYRDESFILEFLTPHLIRKLKLFSIETKKEDAVYKIGNIHNNDGYVDIRNIMASQYAIDSKIPDFRIFSSSGYSEAREKRYSHSNGIIDWNVDGKDALCIYLADKNGNSIKESDLIMFMKYLKLCWIAQIFILVLDSSGDALTTIRGSDYD